MTVMMRETDVRMEDGGMDGERIEGRGLILMMGRKERTGHGWPYWPHQSQVESRAEDGCGRRL